MKTSRYTSTGSPLRATAALAVLLAVFFSYSFINAAWINAPANPPNSNTDAPLNTGSVTQTKTGNITLQNAGPMLGFDDTAGEENNKWWIHTNASNGSGPRLYFLYDRNNSGAWDGGDGTVSLYVKASSTKTDGSGDLLKVPGSFVSDNVLAPSGVVGGRLGLGGCPWGPCINDGGTNVYYETIQYNPNNNLRFFSGSNERMLLESDGNLTVTPNGTDPLMSSGMPNGWAGGLHTFDVYANGSVGVGKNGRLAAGITNTGGFWGDQMNANKYCDGSGNNCFDAKEAVRQSFGGMYSRASDLSCRFPNPMAGGCSCPPNFLDITVASDIRGGEQSLHYCMNDPDICTVTFSATIVGHYDAGTKATNVFLRKGSIVAIGAVASENQFTPAANFSNGPLVHHDYNSSRHSNNGHTLEAGWWWSAPNPASITGGRNTRSDIDTLTVTDGRSVRAEISANGVGTETGEKAYITATARCN